jgi:predicted site-specific integrase-resolvase
MPEFNRDDYLRPADVATRWGVSGEAVRYMIRHGLLPALVMPNGRYLIHKNDTVLRPAWPRT